VRGEGYGKNGGSGPAEEQSDRVGEQSSGPAEVPSYVTVAVKLGIRLGGECAGEKDSEEKKDDPANLAGERGRRGLIVPVRARAS
jgi:hypothetical protein